jgi:hypothetical protein
MSLVIKATYSSSMVRRQDGSARVVQTEVSTDESDDDEVADRVSLSAGSHNPRFTPVVMVDRRCH